MPPPPNTFTELVITGLAAPYAVRGLTQTLEPISQASQVWRTINGSLLDVSTAQFRKYRSVISCTDMRAPALDGIWPGQQVTIDCVSFLAYAVGGMPSRTVVPGSAFTEEGYVYYRPRLVMTFLEYTTSEDEYGATNSWSATFEE